MIRTTPQRRFHVSNRAALVAALVLAISSFASLYKGADANNDVNGQSVAATSQADNSATNGSRKQSKLSVSLLLFGRG